MADNKLFDSNSEAIVISTILRNPALIFTVESLRAYMFSSNPFINMFEEMEALREKGLNPDPSILIESLDSKGTLTAAGGKKLIIELAGKETNAEAFSEFVSIVVDSYRARSYLSTVSGVTKSVLNSSNLDDSIRDTRQKLDNLMEAKHTVDAVHVKDLVKDTYADIIKRLEKPGIRGASWGVNSLDSSTGGKSPGDLWVIGGRPGAGKSAVVCNSVLTDGLANIPTLLIEREMRAQELMERLICIDTGIPNTNIRLGLLNKEQTNMIRDSLKKIEKLPIYLDTNYRACDPHYVEAVVNKFRNKHGVEIVYLDYIQLLAERDENQTQEIGQLARLFKIMSNELNICSILLSQLNRNVEYRDDKRPMLSDLRQSGALEEDTDFVIGLYRDEYYNKETKSKGLMDYMILKHRNGAPGTVTIRFDGPTSKISEY